MKKLLSLFLVLTMIMTYLPVMGSAVSSESVTLKADASTMDGWKDFFFPDSKISTQNAGKVWSDKSVFTNANAFSSQGITIKNDNSFLVALSTIGSNITITGMSHVPTDTMLVLDVSGSMNNNNGNNDVAEELVIAANQTIRSLLEMNDYNRVGVVLYSGPLYQNDPATSTDAIVLLPLGRYTTGTDQQYLTYTTSTFGGDETVSLSANVKYESTGNAPFQRRPSKDVEGATYIQKGIVLAKDQLIEENDQFTVNDTSLGTVKRSPIIVLMSDGAPSLASTNFQNPTSYDLGSGSGSSAPVGFATQLSLSWAKNEIEAKYNNDCFFYTMGLGINKISNTTQKNIATSVLNPTSTSGSTAMNDFWETWDETSFGNDVVLSTDWRGNPTRTVEKIAGLDKNYVDEYIEVAAGTSNADLGDDLIEAFKEIVGKIELQSLYKPTLVSQNEDLEGYISFVDKIGNYMSVSDVKGIIIDDTLFSGATLSSNFVTGGGLLGTGETATDLGHEMVNSVKERLGIESTEIARALIFTAYEHGQLSYNQQTGEYSNYIGWYANANGDYLGFYDEDTTTLVAVPGNAEKDPVYTIKSYGYLGKVDASHGVSESDLMYATVQVRTNIKTGEETVAFAVPAALIPVVTYEVALDDNGNVSDLKTSGAEHPIRMVYEVSLDSEINEFNVTEKVSQSYLNENSQGENIHFYTNAWEETTQTGSNSVNTYTYFNPSRQNEKYYFTSDSPIYSDQNGTLYSGDSKPNPNGTYYRAYTVYEKTATSAATQTTVYRQLSKEALETANKTQGSSNWYIPKGDIYVNMEGLSVLKSPSANATQTLDYAYAPFVNTDGHSVDDTGYNFFVGATLGNNGRFTLTSQTGVKLTKTLDEDATQTDKEFVFEITKSPVSSSTNTALLVDIDGTENSTTVSFDNSGKALVKLKAGQTIYIGDLNNNDVITVTELEDADYIVSDIKVNGVSTTDAVTTLSQGEISTVEFVNEDRGYGNLTITKEITHPFGTDYQISTVADFEVTVTLTGPMTASKTFLASNTDATLTSVTTDQNGTFTVTLGHGESVEIFNLPEGTQVKVVETTYGNGFTPKYHNNNVESANAFGEVTVENNKTALVLVENAYTPSKVSDVNINLSGEKIIKNPDQTVVENWDDDFVFDITLERFNKTTNKWETVDTQTVDKDNKTFTFDMSNEVYTQAGTYSYQIYEVEPSVDSADRVDGIIYDITWHTFSVYVEDKNMDGELEITRVHSEHANKDFPIENGDYKVEVQFNNTKSVEIPALAIINVKKILNNDTGSNRVTQAGFKFELYQDENCTIPVVDITDELHVERVATDAVGEGWIDLVMSKTTPTDAPYVFYIKEVDEGVKGIEYDPTVIKVVVEVTNSATTPGALEASVEYFDLNDNPVSLNADGQLEFENTYKVTAFNYPVDFVEKTLDGRNQEAKEFSFEVRELDGTVLAQGENDEFGKVTFDKALHFEKAGLYTYEIVEVNTNVAGVTYDQTVFTILVTVTDNNGDLTATHEVLNVPDNSVVFENSYKAKETTYTISGNKDLRGRDLINDEFKFVLTEALNAQGDVASNAKVYYAYNLNDGTFAFEQLTYTEAGTYYYVVSEEKGGESEYGVNYDDSEIVVTVTVEDDYDLGKLVATADKTAQQLTFVNTYIASATSQNIPGEKVLTGKTLVNGQFEFELYKSNAQWQSVKKLQTVSNAQDGTFAFDFVDYDVTDPNVDNTKFTKAGNYYYLIKEVNGGQKIDGITYDNTVYRIRVEITDDNKGKLVATVHIYDENSVPQDEVAFENSYEIEGNATVTLNGTKKVNDEVPVNRTFEFELYPATDDTYQTLGTAIKKQPQDANGEFKFELSYSPDDISDTPYYYVVKEVNAGQTIYGVTYDTTQYYIEVKVEDDDVGGIKTTTKIKKNGVDSATSLDFNNKYVVASKDITIEGKKELENRTLGENEFKFFLYEADSNFVIDTNKTPKETLNKGDKSFAFEPVTITKAGTYYFVVKEDADTTADRVTNDTAVYNVAVEIKENFDIGELYENSRTITKVEGTTSQPATEILFTNVFTPKPDDITVDMFIEKTMVYKGATVVTSRGFEFVLENTKTSEKFFTQTDAQGDGKFTLAFTEDDIGKTYTYTISEVNDHRRYIIYSNAVYEITVSISLDADNKLVASFTKDALAVDEVVAEFENIFRYEEPDKPKPIESPDTSDNSNLYLWIALMFISGCGAVGLTLYNKKREDN